MAMPEMVPPGRVLPWSASSPHAHTGRPDAPDDKVAPAGMDLREAYRDRFLDAFRIEEVGIAGD
jgi:hypothetical protein